MFYPHIGVIQGFPHTFSKQNYVEYDDQKKGYYKSSKIDKAEASVHFLSWTS